MVLRQKHAYVSANLKTERVLDRAVYRREILDKTPRPSILSRPLAKRPLQFITAAVGFVRLGQRRYDLATVAVVLYGGVPSVEKNALRHFQVLT